jgi:hypothetical protein
MEKRQIENTFDRIKSYIELLESLFVFGTKAENLKEVIETLKQEQSEVLLGDLFEINPLVKDKDLLIPVYRDSKKILVEENQVVKYLIHPEDYQTVKNYFHYIGEKIALCKFDCNLKVLSKLKQGFNGKKQDFFIETNEQIKLNNPEFLLQNIFKHFSNYSKEFNSFKELEEEIIHFKRIHITADKLNSLREKIQKVKKFPEKEKLEKELDEEFRNKDILLDQYKSRLIALEKEFVSEEKVEYSFTEKLNIKYLANHYYLPLALSEAEQVNFIKHIIKHKSEIEFIYQLENYLQKENNFFTKFDWWFFSKIDETLDEVYIPYYNPKTNRIDKFKPDFIFWLSKQNQYNILFIDPKGTEHTDGYRKIDGYSQFFEDYTFSYNNLKVKVSLLLATSDIANVLENYKKYWFDIPSLEQKLESWF